MSKMMKTMGWEEGRKACSRHS